MHTNTVAALKETDGGEKKAVTSTNGCAGLEKYCMNSVLSANEPGVRRAHT